MARVADASGNFPANASGIDPSTGPGDNTVTARDAVAVTPSDTVDLPTGCRALYVGGAGDLSVVTQLGNTVLFSAVPAGTTLEVAARRVRSTATTATLITAMY